MKWPTKLGSATVEEDAATAAGRPAHRIHEVEVKYRVEDLDALLAAIARAAVVLGPAVEQHDQAYACTAWSPGTSKIGVPFARLRTEAGRHLFTVKVPQDNELACLERETVVSDRDGMHHALLLMGFVPTQVIRKIRRVGAWRDTTICVDVVHGLGVFIELEKMVSAAESGTVAQAELDRWVRGLDVSAVRMDQTYDSLLRTAAVGAGAD